MLVLFGLELGLWVKIQPKRSATPAAYPKDSRYQEPGEQSPKTTTMDSPVVQLMLFFNEFNVPETKERNYSETIGGHLLPEAR